MTRKKPSSSGSDDDGDNGSGDESSEYEEEQVGRLLVWQRNGRHFEAIALLDCPWLAWSTDTSGTVRAVGATVHCIYLKL